MSPQQDQDAALGSNPAKSTRNAPTIDPEKSLAKYQISCIVDSVYYYPDPDGEDSGAMTHTCAVVLEVGFRPLLTQGQNFVRATFPTRVLDTRLDRYPDADEVVEMDGCTVRDGVAVTFNLQVAGTGANLGGYNLQKERTVFKLLQLLPQRGEGYDEIRWRFKNENLNHYFPSAIRLLLLVRGDSSPRFPFTLEILPTLEVHANLQKSKWHFWPNTIKLQPECSDGWSCEINDVYYPNKAKDALCEHRKPLKDREPSKMVGLRAALISCPAAPQR